MAVVRSNGYWFYEFRIGGQRIKRTSGYRVDEISREEVRAKEPEVRAKILEELGINAAEKKRYRLSEAAQRMYEEHWSRKKDSETPMQRIEAVIKIIGDKMIDNITAEDLNRIKTTLLARGRQPSTVNRYLSALTKLLNTAHKYWEVIDKVPAAPKESEDGNERVRVVTWEEEQRILEACDHLGDEDFKDLYITLVDTGLRLSEALHLTYSANIDFESNAITIWTNRANNRQQKNAKAKTIPMTERVRKLLRRRKLYGDKPFACFTSRHTALYRLKKVLKEAGLAPEGDIVIHSLRHTFASRALASGVDIYTVKELLGHRSVTTTERYYAHLAVKKLKEAIRLLERTVNQ